MYQNTGVGHNQLCSYRAADLRLCFHIYICKDHCSYDAANIVFQNSKESNK